MKLTDGDLSLRRGDKVRDKVRDKGMEPAEYPRKGRKGLSFGVVAQGRVTSI